MATKKKTKKKITKRKVTKRKTKKVTKRKVTKRKSAKKKTVKRKTVKKKTTKRKTTKKKTVKRKKKNPKIEHKVRGRTSGLKKTVTKPKSRSKWDDSPVELEELFELPNYTDYDYKPSVNEVEMFIDDLEKKMSEKSVNGKMKSSTYVKLISYSYPVNEKEALKLLEKTKFYDQEARIVEALKHIIRWVSKNKNKASYMSEFTYPARSMRLYPGYPNYTFERKYGKILYDWFSKDLAFEELYREGIEEKDTRKLYDLVDRIENEYMR